MSCTLPSNWRQEFPWRHGKKSWGVTTHNSVMEGGVSLLTPAQWGSKPIDTVRQHALLRLSSDSGRSSAQCTLAMYSNPCTWWARICKQWPLDKWKEALFSSGSQQATETNLRACSVHILLSLSLPLFLTYFPEELFNHILSLASYTGSKMYKMLCLKMVRSIKFFWWGACNSECSYTWCSV